MKRLASTIIILLSAFFTFAQGNTPQLPIINNDKLASQQESIDEDWLKAAQNLIGQQEYYFKKDKAAALIYAANSKQRVSFAVNPVGYKASAMRSTTKPVAAWEQHFDLSVIRKGSLELKPGEQYTLHCDKSALSYHYPGFIIEYINSTAGLRQNFIVSQKAPGRDNLEILLNIQGDLQPVIKNNGLQFNDRAGKATFFYNDLKVWDADKKRVKALMELRSDNELAIIVEDQEAKYPLTIDPLNNTPEWTSGADGVLPSLITQLQIDAIYGYTVAGLGDINGDGYDDVAIGAPGAVDIFTGTGTIAGVGAVFVFRGSATGLSTTPSNTLQPNTAVAGALFGYSIAGGDITGDGRNDIVAGAPGDSYTANIGGPLGGTTATVVAGKVYIYPAEILAAANPGTFLSVYLDGAGFFNNGVLGILANNISINATFGFSVGITEDLGIDGKGELIVGSPGYAAVTVLPLLPVRTGTALVYYSTNLLTNTPVQLTAPTISLLGIPLLSNGLLFGYSVDGLGDYNMDGEPDVVVGAPAGISLTFPDLLGGSAYVYYGIAGSPGGINTTIGTQLKSSGSLISTVANLFGYSVRGVRNADGTRNGNVLVGAPVGNVLSDLLPGLRLKTGRINVFVRKASPGSAELPDQNFTSPRATSLLSILVGQNINVKAMFGASIDNMLDVNCDGINDIIAGEPLSTGVGLIGANAVGGAAYVFLGRPDGTYIPAPYWTLENTVSFAFGINAGSLLGYSVAGARHVRGQSLGVKALVGAPGAMLDFSSGIFNFNATFNTLFGFVAGSNGLGKAYLYGFFECGFILNPDVNVTWVNIPVPGNVSTNDKVPPGTTYGTPIPQGGNPPGGSITMNPDGSYSFTSPNPGVYYYEVPVCIPGQAPPCPTTQLKITVLDDGSSDNPPVANTDIATTLKNNPVTLNTLANDRCTNTGCSLNPASVTVTDNPNNGSYSVNPVNGDITYTPNPGFVGQDTLTYQVCDNGVPPECASALQIITVYDNSAANTTTATDDYSYTSQGMSVNGNARTNDVDPEGHTQTVVAQVTTIPGTGTLTLNSDGSYTFVPETSFFGPVDFPYTTCDNGSPSVCASATIHILVNDAGPLPIYLSKLTGTYSDGITHLSWSTAQEVNSSHFEIERSTNGTNYVYLGKVTAMGNSDQKTDYSFNDRNVNAGVNYYRLKMLDKDGRFTYSNVIAINVNIKGTFITAVYPVPFTDRINVGISAEHSGQVSIRLLDYTGKLISSKQSTIYKGVNSIVLENLGNLSKGSYILQVQAGDIMYSQKLVR